jgi:stage II sporulation protein D
MEKERTWSLQSSGALTSSHLGGIDISPKLAYLMALNILPPKTDAAFLKKPAEFEDVMNWIRTALGLLGKKNEKFMPKNAPLNFVNYAHLLTDAFQWQDRVQNLLLKSEAEHILKDSSALNAEEKNDLAYLVKSGIFPSTPDFGSWERALSNAEAAYYLYKIISTYKDFYHRGNFKSSDKNRIEVMEDGEKKQAELSPDLFLLEDFDETTIFASSIDFSGGEAMRWVESDGKVRLIELFPSPLTNILDQPSQFHRWQVRISREDLEARINLFYPIGKLIDLVPQKRGVSRRVIDMSVIGREGQVGVTGLKIRQALGLRDNLFVIDRQQDQDGQTTHFIFTGKGWGHGVGLCQVGAYRMAQKGATCEEILKKYYQGISINKIF